MNRLLKKQIHYSKATLSRVAQKATLLRNNEEEAAEEEEEAQRRTSSWSHYFD
jgi:hypothetical protein